MLFKNFGVQVDGRVICYGYDEIEYMTDCQCYCIAMAAHWPMPPLAAGIQLEVMACGHGVQA